MEISLEKRAYYGMDEKFTLSLTPEDLMKGLRPSSHSPRNTPFDVVCSGVIGRDGALVRQESLTRIDTSVITDGFPYPQIFTFPNLILVCGSTKIYEFTPPSTLTLKLTTTAGNLWSCVAVGEYVYMSNGVVAVERNPETKAYATSSDVPICEAICDFNKQIIIGAPTIASILSEL
jgi:hypothetical protein